MISPMQRLLTDNTHKRQSSMPPAGFEPTIPVSEWPQTHALDRAANGNGKGDIQSIHKTASNSIISVWLISSEIKVKTKHKYICRSTHVGCTKLVVIFFIDK